MKTVQDLLDGKGIAYTVLPSGDLFFRRATRGVMYVRRYDDGTLDWTTNNHSDENLMEWRPAVKQEEGKTLEAIRSFLSA